MGMIAELTILACLSLLLHGLSANCVPRQGCRRALAFYTVDEKEELGTLLGRFSTGLIDLAEYNNVTTGEESLPAELLIPFTCQCLNGGVLGHEFPYEVVADDALLSIANVQYQGLTKPEWITAATPLADQGPIFAGLKLKIPVNCSCGDPQVSKDYGLFLTYVVQGNDTLEIIKEKFNVTSDLVEKYNPDVQSWQNLATHTILFLPITDKSGNYPRYSSANEAANGGMKNAIIIGASIGAALLFLTVLGSVIAWFLLKKKHSKNNTKPITPSPVVSGALSSRKAGTPPASAIALKSSSASLKSALSDFALDKSIEFSFEELAAATNNFSDIHKIGQGGYGSVYYGYLRNQKLAVKRMNLQATKEFLAELKVLSRVHHTNLVQLIGYCTVESLFLVYEFVDNGTLAQHLHGSGKEALTWELRLQIALDTARGLEYIHDHTKPTYIHRDVKSTNILLDRTFHAKVADFGLTKLTESGVGSMSLTQPTRLVGTFGYMSPEYARFGDVSQYLDVYSFGVVLFEIISAQQAIVWTTTRLPSQLEEQKGLVTLFEDVLKDPNGKEKLKMLVDPRLGDNYPLDAAWSLAQLAGACTKENPDLRPNMRTVMVALMTLSSLAAEASASRQSYSI